MVREVDSWYIITWEDIAICGLTHEALNNKMAITITDVSSGGQILNAIFFLL